MNRGLARRTAFESAADVRAFLALLAREVRAHKIAIHAFCVMTTHFHLLAQSVDGELGPTIGRVLNGYVRRFNRGRRRDGSLFRGRFRSRPVTTETYRRVLVRYIDLNPVQARLVECPVDYPHGSAQPHVQPVGSPWLERHWIRERIEFATGARTVDRQSIPRRSGGHPTPDSNVWSSVGSPLRPRPRTPSMSYSRPRLPASWIGCAERLRSETAPRWVSPFATQRPCDLRSSASGSTT